MSPQFAATTQIRRDAAGVYEFSCEADEITIMDQRGLSLWKMRKAAQADRSAGTEMTFWGNAIGGRSLSLQNRF